MAPIRTADDAALVRRARWTLFISVAVTLALYVVPYGYYVAYPLILISTVVHELGHGIAALLVGADFVDFRMWADGSGRALHSMSGGAFARAFVAAGGLCGPAVAAGLFLAAGRDPKWARRCLGAFGLFLAVCLVLWVRGSFGMLFVGALAAACIALAVIASDQIGQLGLVFLAVQLALSVYSRSDYLFTRVAETATGPMPSDVQQMADALAAPYWFWGGLCAAFSAAVLLIGGWTLVRGAHGRRAGR